VVSDAIHPEAPLSTAAWKHSLETGYPYDVEHRLDIEDRKQAEEKLRRSETDLMEVRSLAS
jgi:hypothetical protein